MISIGIFLSVLFVILIVLIAVLIVAMFNSPHLFSDSPDEQKRICITGYGLLFALTLINTFISLKNQTG